MAERSPARGASANRHRTWSQVSSTVTTSVQFLVSTDEDVKATGGSFLPTCDSFPEQANSQKVALAKGRGTPIVQEGPPLLEHNWNWTRSSLEYMLVWVSGFLGCCIAAKSLLDHCTFLIKADVS